MLQARAVYRTLRGAAAIPFRMKTADVGYLRIFDPNVLESLKSPSASVPLQPSSDSGPDPVILKFKGPSSAAANPSSAANKDEAAASQGLKSEREKKFLRAEVAERSLSGGKLHAQVPLRADSFTEDARAETISVSRLPSERFKLSLKSPDGELRGTFQNDGTPLVLYRGSTRLQISPENLKPLDAAVAQWKSTQLDSAEGF